MGEMQNKVLEVLSEIASRMAETPGRAEALVMERGEASDALHEALEAAKEIEVAIGGQVANERGRDGRPVYGNSAQRAAEERVRLNKNNAWKKLQAEIDQQRVALRRCDAQLENLRLRFKADESLVKLATALISAGRVEEAERIVYAYRGREAREQSSVSNQAQSQEQNGLKTGTFTVLEVSYGKSKGTVRAWCQGEDGCVAVYGKYGLGQKLAASVGRKVEIKYTHGKKGLLAASVA
jgi:hypothetical protein